VQVLESTDDLHDLALDLNLSQAFASANLLVDGLVLAQLQEDVDELCVFEEVVEAHDVLVLEGAVDADLTHKFLFGPRFDQRGLGHDLGGQDLLGLEAGELLDAGKPALA